MSLDKAIASGKEHRKPYQGGKAYCQSCRNHGGCTWCLSNRTHKYNKKIEALKLEEKEFEQKIQDIFKIFQKDNCCRQSLTAEVSDSDRINLDVSMHTSLPVCQTWISSGAMSCFLPSASTIT